MLIKFKKNLQRKGQFSKGIKRLALILTIFLFSFFTFSKNLYAVSCYTDAWGDDSAVPEGTTYGDELGDNDPTPLYIIGSGNTSINYYEPYHDAEVITTLTSPSGQQVIVYGDEVSTNFKQFHSRAETEMAWSFSEVGNFTITSEHYSYCPYANFGSTVSNFPIGISYIAMQLAVPQSPSPLGVLYEKVTPCDVYCNVPLTNRYPGPPVAYIQLQIPFGPFGCSKLVRVVRNVQAGICFDVGYN